MVFTWFFKDSLGRLCQLFTVITSSVMHLSLAFPFSLYHSPLFLIVFLRYSLKLLSPKSLSQFCFRRDPNKVIRGFPGGAMGKNLLTKAGDTKDMGWILESGRAPGVGSGNLLQVLPKKFHEQKSLVGYTICGVTESHS